MIKSILSFLKGLFSPVPMPQWMQEADEEIKRRQEQARLRYQEFEVRTTYNRAAGDRHKDRKQVKHVFLVRGRE